MPKVRLRTISIEARDAQNKSGDDQRIDYQRNDGPKAKDFPRKKPYGCPQLVTICVNLLRQRLFEEPRVPCGDLMENMFKFHDEPGDEGRTFESERQSHGV